MTETNHVSATESRFQFRFFRPDSFEYTYEDDLGTEFPSQIYEIWSERNKIFGRGFDDVPTEFSEHPLSVGSCYTLSNRNLPVTYSFLQNREVDHLLQDFSLIPGDVFIDNEKCYELMRIKVSEVTPNQTRIWISAARNLILKSKETFVVNPVRAEAVQTSLFDDFDLTVEEKMRIIDKTVRKTISQTCSGSQAESMLLSLGERVYTEETIYEKISVR